MRHLIIALTFLSTVNVFATSEAMVNAAMDRGALTCSVGKANLKVGGVILDDKSQGIKFEYSNGAIFIHKFVGKTISPEGKITIHGHLVALTKGEDKVPAAKSWFSLSEEQYQREEYHAFQYSPVYKMDGTPNRDKIGRINLRCPNLKQASEYLPVLSQEQVDSLKAANSLN